MHRRTHTHLATFRYSDYSDDFEKVKQFKLIYFNGMPTCLWLFVRLYLHTWDSFLKKNLAHGYMISISIEYK